LLKVESILPLSFDLCPPKETQTLRVLATSAANTVVIVLLQYIKKKAPFK
jgi:hypothetical protein